MITEKIQKEFIQKYFFKNPKRENPFELIDEPLRSIFVNIENQIYDIRGDNITETEALFSIYNDLLKLNICEK